MPVFPWSGGYPGDPAHLAAAVALIRSGRALLFAGSGCSGPAFPSWHALLARMEDLCDLCAPGFRRDDDLRRDDPLRYADRVKDHIQRHKGSLERYHQFLIDTFRVPPRVEQFQLDLVSLPFRGIVTTNYDGAIEKALWEVDLPSPDTTIDLGMDSVFFAHQFLKSLSSPTDSRRVAHLHGFYRHPERIVLSESDYASAYGTSLPASGGSMPEPNRRTPLYQFAREILGEGGREVVFVGFSLKDPYLRALLAACADANHTWGDPDHFAILGTTEASYDADVARALDLKERHGIQVVFYEVTGDSHALLQELVADIRRQVSPPPEPLLVNVNRRMAEEMRE